MLRLSTCCALEGRAAVPLKGGPLGPSKPPAQLPRGQTHTGAHAARCWAAQRSASASPGADPAAPSIPPATARHQVEPAMQSKPAGKQRRKQCPACQTAHRRCSTTHGGQAPAAAPRAAPQPPQRLQLLPERQGGAQRSSPCCVALGGSLRRPALLWHSSSARAWQSWPAATGRPPTPHHLPPRPAMPYKGCTLNKTTRADSRAWAACLARSAGEDTNSSGEHTSKQARHGCARAINKSGARSHTHTGSMRTCWHNAGTRARRRPLHAREAKHEGSSPPTIARSLAVEQWL